MTGKGLGAIELVQVQLEWHQQPHHRQQAPASPGQRGDLSNQHNANGANKPKFSSQRDPVRTR